MKLYTEKEIEETLESMGLELMVNDFFQMSDPIELPNDLNTFKRIIEDRPTEFSQYNAYTLLYVIDLIQNGKEVPEQIELLRLIRQNK